MSPIVSRLRETNEVMMGSASGYDWGTTNAYGILTRKPLGKPPLEDRDEQNSFPTLYVRGFSRCILSRNTEMVHINYVDEEVGLIFIPSRHNVFRQSNKKELKLERGCSSC
jgi:hypothetical protein